MINGLPSLSPPPDPECDEASSNRPWGPKFLILATT